MNPDLLALLRSFEVRHGYSLALEAGGRAAAGDVAQWFSILGLTGQHGVAGPRGWTPLEAYQTIPPRAGLQRGEHSFPADEIVLDVESVGHCGLS